MADTVAIYSDDRKLAFELIAQAKSLGLRAIVWAVGEKVPNPEEFAHRGADAVHVVESPALAHHPVDVVATVMQAGVPASGAKYIFIGGNKHGKELAPYVAAKLGAGMITAAHHAKMNADGRLEFERLFLGGKTIATEVPTSPVVVATFATRLMEPLPADPSKKGEEILHHKMDLHASKLVVKEVKQRQSSGVNLEEAPLVVGAGRGFKTKDDLKLAFDLAKELGGQVGCSRPLATDLGWLTDEYWIGLSGKEVKPKLYIA
ncbi:MAG: electron transfer flavoprotein subunit alpha/FixB family protein, partial [Thermoplasmatota archaeon]